MMKKVPNPIDRHVGSRVRMRRMLAGVSQEKLGEALGLTFQQVQKYEKGTNRISASRLQQIAKMLDVPVSFFFDGAPTGDMPAGGLLGRRLDAPMWPTSCRPAKACSSTRPSCASRAAEVRRRIVDLVEALGRGRQRNSRDSGASVVRPDERASR